MQGIKAAAEGRHASVRDRTMQYPSSWSGLSSDPFSDLCVNMDTKNCIRTPSCLGSSLAQPACPFYTLETALQIPDALHKEESHFEAPLLNPETINQSWSEAEAISSLL